MNNYRNLPKYSAQGEAASGASGKPLDLESLKQLYGEDTVKELLAMSLDESSGLMDQMETAMGTKDSKVMMAAAHQLKGLASTMTMNDLAAASFEVEQQARNENWETIPGSHEKLKEVYACAQTFISDWLSKNP